MEYDEMHDMIEDPIFIVSEEMTLSTFLELLFWRGTAQANDMDRWEGVPKSIHSGTAAIPAGHPNIHLWGPLVKFQHEGSQYKMKVVEAFNQNIKAGEWVWWVTKQYFDPSVPAPPKEWQYATTIELTREGDPDVLRIWQTYGEPHGVWEWDLEKFGNPATINYLRLK